MGKIQIRSLRCPARIGINEQERSELQELKLDVTLWLNLDLPGRSDNLVDTVDYKSLADDLRASVLRARPALLESLATQLCQEILRDERIRQVKIRIRKRPASMRPVIDWVAVERKAAREAPRPAL